jgi:hypothetical protein
MSYQRLIGPHRKVGRPVHDRRYFGVCAKYGLNPRATFTRRLLSASTLDQLDLCKNIAARRILLGCSK